MYRCFLLGAVEGPPEAPPRSGLGYWRSDVCGSLQHILTSPPNPLIHLLRVAYQDVTPKCP
nr:MAG TPA: hypothetical protein [Bacteriophage sp.]